MKTYENIINGTRYWYFFDIHYRVWTVFKVDENNYQVGAADHHANKTMLLSNYDFDFKNVIEN